MKKQPKKTVAEYSPPHGYHASDRRHMNWEQLIGKTFGKPSAAANAKTLKSGK